MGLFPSLARDGPRAPAPKPGREPPVGHREHRRLDPRHGRWTFTGVRANQCSSPPARRSLRLQEDAVRSTRSLASEALRSLTLFLVTCVPGVLEGRTKSTPVTQGRAIDDGSLPTSSLATFDSTRHAFPLWPQRHDLQQPSAWYPPCPRLSSQPDRPLDGIPKVGSSSSGASREPREDEEGRPAQLDRACPTSCGPGSSLIDTNAGVSQWITSARRSSMSRESRERPDHIPNTRRAAQVRSAAGGRQERRRMSPRDYRRPSSRRAGTRGHLTLNSLSTVSAIPPRTRSSAMRASPSPE